MGNAKYIPTFIPSPRQYIPHEFSQETKLRDSIIDSGIWAKVMDLVVEYNGDFDIGEFSLGQ